jgi:hypothetical protein
MAPHEGKKKKVSAPHYPRNEFFALAVVANSSEKENPDPEKPDRERMHFRNPRTPGRSSCAPAELYPPTRTGTVTKKTLNENLKIQT